MNTADDSIGFRIWGADDVVYGPVELPTLVDWVREERVEANTWIFSEASDSWTKASKLPELSIVFRKRTPGAGPGRQQENTPLVKGIQPGMLRRVKILSEFNEQQLGRFVQFMEVQQVRQFSEIVKKGDHGDSMFLVLEGEVRVRVMNAGRETTLVTLPAGEFFGEMTLFDQGPRSADVVANNDTTLLKISAEKFQKLITEVPDLATPFLVAITKTLTARIRADNKRYQDSMNFGRAATSLAKMCPHCGKSIE
ncbi:MAG: cyclic nucleotide-binding domain-containing protein [Verrucomicrobiota bacterium]